MKHLVITYPGSEAPNGTLTEAGAIQMMNLADRLKREIKSSSAAVYSSLALWAVESAEIIAETLGVQPVQTKVLGNAMGYTAVNEAIENLLEEMGMTVDVVILVTHTGTMHKFSEYYVRHVLKTNAALPHARQGEAILFNHAPHRLAARII